MYVIWAALLLALALGLVVLEVFIPSGGILGFLAAASLVASVVVAFMSSPGAGVGFVIIGLVALPAAIVLALRVWPHTAIGKRILLEVPTSDDVRPDDAQKRGLYDLIGKFGTARSLMLPSGGVTVDGRTIDAISEGMAVESGQKVRIIQVRGNRVVVRPVEDDEPTAGKDETYGDLSRPIESLGLDSLEDPLA
jgi:membrane-bound ClpP family serine protease